MPTLPGPIPSQRRVLAMVLAGVVAVVPASLADVVHKHDGGTVEGDVLSVDADHVIIKVDSNRIRIPRYEVASIEFTEEAAPAPLKVEIRNVRTDDALTVLLEDEVIIRDARVGGSWIDLTPKLNNGNNRLRFLIRNDRNTWAYRVNIRINGVITVLNCGDPPSRDRPCRCCGMSGGEIGLIEDLPPIWINVDRELGEAEILQ